MFGTLRNDQNNVIEFIEKENNFADTSCRRPQHSACDKCRAKKVIGRIQNPHIVRPGYLRDLPTDSLHWSSIGMRSMQDSINTLHLLKSGESERASKAHTDTRQITQHQY